jgi:DnaJ-class molecular chaperone
MHLECERCKGVGLVIKYPCLDCKATGIHTQKIVERISIPPGA